MLKNDESNDEDKNRASAQIVMSNHIQMISMLNQFVILSITLNNNNYDTYQIIARLNLVNESENLWIVLSKKIAKMKQQITHLIYDTNVENHVELDLKMMITQLSSLFDLARKLQHHKTKIFDTLAKSKYRVFIQTLAVNVEQLQTKMKIDLNYASNAKSLQRSMILRRLLTLSDLQVFVKKHHDMLNAHLKQMTRSTEFVRKDLIKYSAIIISVSI